MRILLCVILCAECFTNWISFHHHNNVKQTLLLPSVLYRWWKWGPESLGDLPKVKVTQLSLVKPGLYLRLSDSGTWTFSHSSYMFIWAVLKGANKEQFTFRKCRDPHRVEFTWKFFMEESTFIWVPLGHIYLFYFIIELQLTCNITLVSGVQHSDFYMHIHYKMITTISIVIISHHTKFVHHYWLCSPCCTLHPHDFIYFPCGSLYLFISFTDFCVPTPSPSPLATTDLFSVSTYLCIY